MYRLYIVTFFEGTNLLDNPGGQGAFVGPKPDPALQLLDQNWWSKFIITCENIADHNPYH